MKNANASIFEYVMESNPGIPLSEVMKKCNEVNVDGKSDAMFEDVTICVQSVMDKMFITEKEKDIAFIAGFLELSHKTLHLEILQGKTSNVADIAILYRMVETLSKYGCDEELLQGKITKNKLLKELSKYS